MSDKVTGGEVVAALLERAGVTAAFGVISIHNMPILDAFGRRNRIRFVPARSEGGAVNMADAFTRVSGTMGVAVSSTGTGAGNTCGAMVEAETAGTHRDRNPHAADAHGSSPLRSDYRAVRR